MIVIDTKQKMKDAIFRGAELLRYQGKIELANEFEKWVPPRFPVNGNDLKQEGVPGKLIFRILNFPNTAIFTVPNHPKGGKSMSMVIQRLRNKWKETDFQISHEDLVRFIPNIMEDLGIKPQK